MACQKMEIAKEENEIGKKTQDGQDQGKGSLQNPTKRMIFGQRSKDNKGAHPIDWMVTPSLTF